MFITITLCAVSVSTVSTDVSSHFAVSHFAVSRFLGVGVGLGVRAPIDQAISRIVGRS